MSFSFFLLSFGYSFNDFSDVNEDLIAGKSNYLTHFCRRKQVLILLALAITCFIIPVSLFPSIEMAFIVILSIIMAFLYSYRRFGIKQCGIWGLVVSSLAQRVCPLFAIFYIFYDWSFTSLLVTLLSFFIGLRWILIHQAEDQGNDNISHTHSFVASLGSKVRLLSIITTIFVCELLCLSVIFLQNARFSFSFVVPMVYLVFQLSMLPFWMKVGWTRMVISYDFAPLADFYFLWLGIYLVLALTIHNTICIILLFPVLCFGYRYIILDYKYVKLSFLAKKGLLLPPSPKE